MTKLRFHTTNFRSPTPLPATSGFEPLVAQFSRYHLLFLFDMLRELVLASGESKDMIFEGGFETISYMYFNEVQSDSFTGTPLASKLLSGQHFTFKDDNEVLCENYRLNLPGTHFFGFRSSYQ